MKTITLREANQQFSKLMREIEETGETVVVLRNGKPAVKLSPVAVRRIATPEEQEEAKQRLMDPGRSFTFPDDWKFNRDETHADALARANRALTPEQEAVLKSMLETAKRAKPSKGRKLTRDELHER